MYLRHLSTEYRSILSGDMSAESRPTYRPSIGRYVGRNSADISTDINRHACRPILQRHSAATWPILYRHSANTTLICSALATQFYLLCSTKRGFQGPSSLCGLQLRKHSCLFSSYVFFFVVTFVYNPRYFRK